MTNGVDGRLLGSMSAFWDLATSVLILLAGLAVTAWVMRGWWRRSDDRPALLFRWAITVADLLFIVFLVGPLVAQGGFVGAFAGIPMAAVAGLILAIVWVPALTGAVGRQFGRIFDGGDTAPDPEPLFSVAEARRKQGRPREAVLEMQRQLEAFPTHFRAQMFLAETLADDLGDLEGAARTIERLLTQEDHPPRNWAHALTRLADWHLKLARDVDSARLCFERIIERFPDSEEEHLAHQRLAHLGGRQDPIHAAQRRFEVPRADPHLGTRSRAVANLPAGPDPLLEAGRLVHQLEVYPHDNQAREELAVLYMDALSRPDLAVEQIEQLLEQPHAPERQVGRWLNLLADWALRSPGGTAGARAQLGRLIARYPGSATAEAARRRLSLLEFEAKKTAASQPLRIGSPVRAASSATENREG